jgi:uncharacterized protein (TIRG00374 family)
MTENDLSSSQRSDSPSLDSAGADPSGADQRSRGRGRLALRLGVSLVIGGGFIWLMRVGAMPFIPGPEAFARVRWWTLAAYIVGWSAVHVLRAARWRLLLAPLADVSMRRVCVASFIGYLAILVFPLRTGEVVRPLLIRERGRLSAWAVLGTLAAERIVDGLTLSVILFLALQLSTPLDPLPERLGDLPISVAVIPRAAYLALLAFAAALLLMTAFYIWKRPMRRLVEAVLGRISRPFSAWVSLRIESVAEGLSFLSNWRHAVPFVGMTALYWLINALCSWLIAWGVGFEDFTYAEACVATGVLALGVLMPNAPGFFGAFQFALYAGLAIFYARERVLSEGAAFVFLVYLAQTSITVGFAIWAAFVGGETSVWRSMRRRASGT